MRKTYLNYVLFCMMLFVANISKAQTTFTNKATTVEWAFNGSVDDAVSSPTEAISLASFIYGNQLSSTDGQSWDNITYTRFLTTVKGSGPAESNALSWKVKPTKGLTFTPTKVSGTIRRFGTDGGLMDIKAVNGEGESVTLATGIIPARNKNDDSKINDANYRTNFSFDISSTLATSQDFTLVINVYNLDNKKQVGFNDIKIEGTVNGTTEKVTEYSFTTACNPTESADITVNPKGNEFESGTELTVNAARKFGYKFVNWTDANGNIVSTDASFSYTLKENSALTANFQKINTYALNYAVDGGANYYMVQPDIAPNVVNDKNMYEEGTNVTLTASDNDILTFTNWSDGQTSPSITITMNEDKTITASYAKSDFIAAWDFYLSGNNGRKADFYSTDNDADQLVLRNDAGTTCGWLDKSHANGQFEGRDAGVNWQNSVAIGTYYWQTKVNASAFTDIKVKSAMAYNYNAYPTYKVEYSLDGSSWTTLGSIAMPAVKSWTEETFSVPSDANNKADLYIRWIADKSSSIDGTTSTNDGNAISGIYITGKEKLVDDGTAPELVSSIPLQSATNASANGNIVLTFDEKVKLTNSATALIGSQEVTGVVSGKTITFKYKSLNYSSTYSFTLAAGSVADLCDNTNNKEISISFTTMDKPAIDKSLYDFIVPTDGTFKEAVAAAAARQDMSKRFRIFIMKGSYTLPVDESSTVLGNDKKNYPSSTTVIASSNVSVIGEDIDATILTNTVPDVLSSGSNPIEGIGKGDLIQLTGSNTYIQDITLKSGMADGTGRNLAVQDLGNKSIYKNVKLVGYQDTWTSNNQNARYYFEGGIIRGRTDYICGKGDAMFNGVTFLNVEKGGYIAVPSVPKQYGYIMKDCSIKGEDSSNDGNYTLGRPWGSGTPIALWINTNMVSQPSAIGWNEMSGGWPARFAEYNSHTASGTIISLSNRKAVFGESHSNNPILTTDEAATYSVETVMGGDDKWDPTAATEQASAPSNVVINGSTLSWDNSNYALLWAIVKNGKVIDFTTSNSYAVNDASASYAVRAANEMGGLSEATTAKNVSTGIANIDKSTNSNGKTYDIAGRRVTNNKKGLIIRDRNKFINK